MVATGGIDGVTQTPTLTPTQTRRLSTPCFLAKTFVLACCCCRLGFGLINRRR